MVGGGGTGTRASSQSLTKEEKSSAQFLQNALLLNHFTCHLSLSLFHFSHSNNSCTGFEMRNHK